MEQLRSHFKQLCKDNNSSAGWTHQVYMIYRSLKAMKLHKLHYKKGNFIAWMHDKNILFCKMGDAIV